MKDLQEAVEQWNTISFKTVIAGYIFMLLKVNLEEIDRLNSQSHGEEEHRARYGLTKLSDLSKDEYRDIHLLDEKMNKSPHLYNKSWEQYKDWKKRNHSANNHKDHRQHNNVSVIMRKKRAALPMQVDW